MSAGEEHSRKILQYLTENSGITAGDVSQRFSLSRPHAGEILRALRSRGLVRSTDGERWYPEVGVINWIIPSSAQDMPTRYMRPGVTVRFTD